VGCVSGRQALPFIEGKLKKTPQSNLSLQPGALVQVKSKEAIVKTSMCTTGTVGCRSTPRC